jgi:hypothetical protein
MSPPRDADRRRQRHHQSPAPSTPSELATRRTHPTSPYPDKIGQPSPLIAVKAFGEIQVGIADRCDQLPAQEDLTEVGSYRFFAS